MGGKICDWSSDYRLDPTALNHNKMVDLDDVDSSTIKDNISKGAKLISFRRSWYSSRIDNWIMRRRASVDPILGLAVWLNDALMSRRRVFFFGWQQDGSIRLDWRTVSKIAPIFANDIIADDPHRSKYIGCPVVVRGCEQSQSGWLAILWDRRPSAQPFHCQTGLKFYLVYCTR